MPRFLTTLYETPHNSQSMILLQGRRLMEAIHFMHGKGIVHMDIKSDNIFIDADSSWVLGDFGSSRIIGTNITSSNLLHYVRFNLGNAEPKYDWFMLLLVLLKETLEIKNTWLEILCGDDEKYDAELIHRYILNYEVGSPLQSLFLELKDLSENCMEKSESVNDCSDCTSGSIALEK